MKTDHEESDPSYMDENFWVVLIIVFVSVCVISVAIAALMVKP